MIKSFFILAFLPLFSIAQKTKGIIVSQKDNFPIEDVNVYALYNKTGSLTNEKGEFSLNLTAKENDTIQLSHVGYITIKIAVNDLKSLNFIISLPEDVENLSGLTITNNRKIKLKSKLAFEKLNQMDFRVSSFGSAILDEKIYVFGGDGTFKYDLGEKIKTINADDPQYFRKIMEAAGSDINHKFYNDKLSVYDITNNSWQTSNLKLKKRAFHCASYYDGKIYILGGIRASANSKFEYLDNEIEIFDIKNETITIDKTNPHQAINFSSFTYKDNIIVLGGSTKMTEDRRKTFSNKIHLYDIKSGYWYEIANMPEAKETAGILINDKIYLIGGFNGKDLSTIETFDLTTDKWETLGTLFTPLTNPAITRYNDLIYFFEDRKLYVLNTETKMMQQYSIELDLKNSKMYYYNNKLYILGGYAEGEYEKTPSRNTYSIAVEEFATTKPDNSKILSHKSVSAKL